VAIGVLAYLGWAKVEQTWPFGPKDIRELFPGAQEPEEEA
jgi:fructoselysine transporter